MIPMPPVQQGGSCPKLKMRITIPMNKKIQSVLRLLILTNIIMVCVSVFFLIGLSVEFLLQDPEFNHDTSPQRELVKVLGEEQRKLIQEGLREHRERPSYGVIVYVHSHTILGQLIIQGVLAIVSCRLAVSLQNVESNTQTE